jgi:DNA modification methylase
VVHELPPQYLNNVYLGDVMDLLKSLPDGCVDMVYGDPDYNVGIKYGDKSLGVTQLTANPIDNTMIT